MKEKLMKCVPHIMAILLFLVLTGIYFSPEIFDDKSLVQGDVTSSIAWGKDLKDYHQQTGNYAYWSNSMFGGMPHNYTYMAPVFNVFRYIVQILMFIISGNPFLVFLYLVGFYIFMISLGCKPWLSIVGAIAYAFASYNLIIIGAGHVNKALVMATMAPIIGGIILCYRKKYVWGSLVTLIFTGLNVLWNHQQISYYLLLMIFVLAVVYLIYALREHTLKDYFKSSAILVVVGFLAIAPALGSLICSADYVKETMRGGAVLKNNVQGETESSGLDIDYAYAWSYGKGETMTLLIPNFYGASSHYNIGEDSESYNFFKNMGQAAQGKQFCQYAPTYWGDQTFTAGPVYVGAIICFLFMLGLLIVKGPERWWLLAATIISFVLSWGNNFAVINDFLFYHMPLYNKFRTPSMALAIAEVSMVALAMLAIKVFLDCDKDNRKKLLKPLYISAGITGGLCLIFAVLGGSLMSFSTASDANYSNYPELLAAIVSDRKHLLSADAWRSFFLIALSALALWLYATKTFKSIFVVGILGVLVFIDLWTVDKRFLNNDSFVDKKKAREIVATPQDQQILQDKDPDYRVLNLTKSTFNESETSYFHKSIGGYSPAKLRRYQDIIDYYFGGADGINMNVLNMLNTRYVIVMAQMQDQHGQVRQVPQVQTNPGALGNAWFVNELKWVNSPDEEIVALKDFNPIRTAVIDKAWQNKLNGGESLQHAIDSTATIRLTNYANPGNLFYESNSSQPNLAVFSEVFYKTWHAYIDGKEVPLVRVNYILRGLNVPAGKHQIEFRCVDDVYLRGTKISMIASITVGIILVLLFGFGLWTAFKTQKQPEEVEM